MMHGNTNTKFQHTLGQQFARNGVSCCSKDFVIHWGGALNQYVIRGEM